MRPDIAPDRHANLRGWNLAAALGLLAVAFVVERLAPAENKGLPKRRTEAPPSARRWRPATAADLQRPHQRYPRKDGRTSFYASIPTSENTAFWPWPPA